MNENGDNRRPAENISEVKTKLSLLLAILAAVLLLGGFFLGMLKLGVVRLPFVSDSETSETPGSFPEDQLINALRHGSYPDDAAVTYGISSEDYLSMLENAPYIDEYEIVMEVTVSSSSSKMTEEHHISRTAEGFSVDTYREKRLVRKVVGKKGRVTETDYDGGFYLSSKTFEDNGRFTMENEIGIPSLSCFVGADDIYDLEITLVRTQNLNAFHVTYKTVTPRMTETMLVSVDLGLILMAQTVAENGELLYSAEATEINT